MLEAFETKELEINMGPQHPSTHGVLRLILKLDGETIVGTDCDIGYLHRGLEKLSEQRNYIQNLPLTDRLDYLAAVSNNLGYVEAVEKLSRLWETSEPEDRRGLAQSLFEYIAYDLDTQRITDFRLKPWADRFLVLRASLYELEQGEETKTPSFQDGGAEMPPRGFEPLSPP